MLVRERERDRGRDGEREREGGRAGTELLKLKYSRVKKTFDITMVVKSSVTGDLDGGYAFSNNTP